MIGCAVSLHKSGIYSCTFLKLVYFLIFLVFWFQNHCYCESSQNTSLQTMGYLYTERTVYAIGITRQHTWWCGMVWPWANTPQKRMVKSRSRRKESWVQLQQAVSHTTPKWNHLYQTPLHRELSSGRRPRLSSIPTTCTHIQNGLVLNRSWKPLVQRLSGPRYLGPPFIWYVLHMVLPNPKHLS